MTTRELYKAIGVGGYWYLRNTVSTGLPMHPMGDAASLAYPNLWTTALVGNPHPDLWALYFDAVWNVCGPIHWIAALSLPVTLLGLISRTSMNQISDVECSFVRRISAALLLVGSASVLWVTPYLVEDQPGSLNHLRWAYTPARYGLCFSTLSVVCLFTVLSNFVANLATRLRQAVYVLLVCCLVAQIGMRVQSHRQHRVIHPRSLAADQPMPEFLKQHHPSIVTAFGEQGYTVDRYRGAIELLTSNKERFPPLINSWPMIGVELPED